MNITLPITALATLLICACATRPSGPSGTAANASKPAVECVDESPTGSNIKRRRCYANDPESRRQRQAQIDALQRPARANSGAAAQQ